MKAPWSRVATIPERLDLTRQYDLLGVNYGWAYALYGLMFLVFVIGIPTLVLNLVGDLFLNPFTHTITAEGGVLAGLAWIMTAVAGGLFIGLWHVHVGGELHGERVGKFVLTVYQKFVREFHAWIGGEIVRIRRPVKDQILSGENKDYGKLEKGLTDKQLAIVSDWNLYLFNLRNQPFKRLFYLSPALSEEELAKWRPGWVIHQRKWLSYVQSATTSHFSVGLVDQLITADEIIPIVVPAGDDYTYQCFLKGLNMPSLTEQTLEAARTLAQGDMAFELLIENKSLREHLVAKLSADSNSRELAEDIAARLDELRRQSGHGERPGPLRVSRRLMILAASASAAALIFLLLMVFKP